MYDQNGLVTVEEAKGTASGREAANAFLQPTPTQWSISALVDNILPQLENAAMIVIDTAGRKIHFTDDTAKGELLLAAAIDFANDAGNLFQPDSGQTGRSLTWNCLGTEGGNPDNAASFEAIVAPVKPRKSVASLVSAILSAKKADGSAEDVPATIVIDQDGVRVMTNEVAKTSALNALNLNAGVSGVLTLSEPASAGTAAPLPFEGGEIL